MYKAWIIVMLLAVNLAGPACTGDKANVTSAEETIDMTGAEGKADSARLFFYLGYKILDRFGTPVPNARVKLVAVDKEGRPYGPESTWSASRTDADGQARWGTGDVPEMKPGKVQIIAEHPSIGEVRRTVEWADLLHQRPREQSEKPMFVLRAEGGPGLEAWRKEAAKEASRLVAALGKAEEADRTESLTKQIVIQEMMAVPALVQALEDYDNPRRPGFVEALTWTWNGCRGIGPLDTEVKAKARAIYDVAMYIGILREKPQLQLPFRDRMDECPRDYTAYVLKEIEWVIPRLRARAAEAEKKGDVGEARMLQDNLKKWENHLAQMKKSLATMPVSAPAASVPK